MTLQAPEYYDEIQAQIAVSGATPAEGLSPACTPFVHCIAPELHDMHSDMSLQ
jgi:hypothetical protein